MNELKFEKLIDEYQQGLLTGREKALMDEWFKLLGKENYSLIWSAGDKNRLKHKILNEIKNSADFTGQSLDRTLNMIALHWVLAMKSRLTH